MKTRRERSGGSKVSWLRLAVLAWAAGGTAWAAESGMYRGPEGNGIYPETGILRAWPEGGPKLLWKRRLPGSGFSSVTVAGGKVYATEGNSCMLHGFTLDGEEVVRVAGGPSAFKRFGGGSRSTTVVRGDMAITTSPLSDAYAIDLARQERRWAFDVSKAWGEALGQGGWGYSKSPALFRDKLILGTTATRPEDPALLAFDVETGDMAWGTGWGEPLDRVHHYQSPPSSIACFNHKGRWLLAYTPHSYHVLVDAETGRLLWQIKNRGHHDITPTYHAGYLLWGPNSSWHRDPNEPKLDGLQMLRLSDDAASYEVLWTWRENLTEYSQAVVLDGRVYFYGRPGTRAEKPDPQRARGPAKRTAAVKAAAKAEATAGGEDALPEPLTVDKNQPGAFLCLDAETGALIASHPVSPGFAAPGHVVACDGLVFFLELLKSERGPVPRLVMFEPTAKGFERVGVLDVPVDADDLKVKEVEWQGRTPPVIAEKRLFVRYGSIFAFDVRREPASRGWRHDGTGIAPEATPPIRWHEKHNVRWQTDLPAAPASSPVAAPDRVYAPARNGDLMCVDATSGQLLWRRALRESGGGAATAGAQPVPVVREDRVFAVMRDGAVAAFRADGTRLWSATVAPAKGGTPASPVLAGGVLAVQGRDLAGLNADTGATLWRAAAPDDKAYGTPLKLARRGHDLLLTAWGALVRADNGAVAATGLPACEGDAATVAGDTVYVWRPGANGEGSAVTAFQVRDAAGGRVEPRVQWERALPPHAPVCAPLALDGHLYMLTKDGFLVALDAANGATRYAQRVAEPGPSSDPSPRSLLGAGGRLYVVNGDGAGTTFVVDAGPRYREAWAYAAARAAGEPAFFADRQYVAAGSRLFCVAGATPAEPRAPDLVQASVLPLPATPPGVPVSPYRPDSVPDAWVFCGPFKGRDLVTNHLAALGGRTVAMPAAGQPVSAAGTNLAFRALEAAHRWRDRGFTADWAAIDLTACLARRFQSTAYFFTVISNDAPRYVRFGLHTPNGATWNLKDRLDARVWLGGERIAGDEVVKLPRGLLPLTIQVAMGSCEPHGRIWMGPHFEDVTDRYAVQMADYARAAAAWPEYAAANRAPFVLAASGVQRESPEPFTAAMEAAAEALERSPAERQRTVEGLKMRFVAIPERAYEMQATEMTQGQWATLMGSEPWKGQDLTAVGPEYPVTHVSWVDAVRCAERLTRLDPAHQYRLPLEAEWRHAAQTGLNGRWCFGSDASNLVEYAWYGANGEPDRYARPVAQLKASAWGLYDINGNVWEWCGDVDGQARMAKGGAWYSLDWFCDIGKSPRYGARYRNYGLGFRLLREKKAIEPRGTGGGPPAPGMTE